MPVVGASMGTTRMDFVPVDMGSAQEELHTVDVLVAAVRKRDAHDTLKYACGARAGAGGSDTQSHHTCRFSVSCSGCCLASYPWRLTGCPT